MSLRSIRGTPREFHIPAGYEKRLSPHGGSTAVAYVKLTTHDNGSVTPLAVGFLFDRNKPEFHLRYHTIDRMEAHLAKFFDDAKASEAFKLEQAAKRKSDRAKPHPLKLGDILVSSWGYDQTNVDFYQVTAVVGAHTVELRKIAANTVPDSGNGYDRGNCVASPGQFIGAAFQKRADHTGTVKIESYARAYPWDGRPRYWSSYA